MAGALVPKRGSSKIGYEEPVLFGVELRDAREELFVILVCDGLPMGLAFKRAGFESKANNAPSLLFNLPRVQERAQAILAARRETGAVSLPQVTDMLKRVFAGAHSEGEYSAAHNAAFSLARLYGHVTDRATLEVIRRPSRDPDAPSEQALSSWVEALPALSGPGPAALGGPSFERLSETTPETTPEGPHRGAPALPLGPAPGPQPQNANNFKDLAAIEPEARGPGPEPQGDLFNDINWLRAEARGPGPLDREKLNDFKGLGTPGRPENGAPVAAVTGTPDTGARSGLLGGGTGGSKKGAPVKGLRVPGQPGGRATKKRVLVPRTPSAKDLFG